MLQSYPQLSLREILLERIPAFLIITLVVLCYFTYPSWRILSSSPITVFIGAWIYLLAFSLLLRAVNYFSTDIILGGKTPNHTDGGVLTYLVLLIILGVFIGLQFLYITLPILSGPDEPVHISKKLWQWELYSIIPKKNLTIHFLCSFLLVSVLWVIAIPFKTFQSGDRKVSVLAKVLFLFSILALPVILWVGLGNTESFRAELGGDNRWPPLGTVTGVLSYYLFGANEIGARFPSLFYYGATGFLVFLIIKSELGLKAAISGFCVCLASPLFFSYGHLDYREMGGAFFLTMGCYGLYLYARTGKFNYLSFVVIAVSAGYLQRRPVAILLMVAIVICLACLTVHFVQTRKASRIVLYHVFAQILLAMVVVLVVIPWIYATQNIRPYHFYAENFLQLNYLLAYIKKLPEIFPWPIVLLIIPGIVITIIKRTWSGIISVVIVIALYVLFTADDPYWLPVDRFAVSFIPFCAILVSQVHLVISTETWKQWSVTAAIVSVCVLGIIGWAKDSTQVGLLSKNTPTISDYPHYPFQELLFSMKEEGIKKGNILFPVYWQSAFPAYYRMYKIWGYKEIIPSWKASGQRKWSIQNLEDLCQEKECKALVIPFVRQDDGKVKIKWSQDINYASIQSNNVPGFSVVQTYEGRRYGLVLLVPENN